MSGPRKDHDSNEDEKPADRKRLGAKNGSGFSSQTELDDIDPISQTHDIYEEDAEEDTTTATHEKPTTARPSLDLKRTASRTSTVLSRVLTTRSLPDPGPPPDGGFKAWSQVACGWLVIFCTWGWVNSYGAFQTYYTLNLTESVSTISWIGTVQNWLTFFIGAFSGRLLDAGLYVPCLIVGSVLQVLGIFLMSVSHTFWQLMLTQGVLTGLGGGIFFTPSMGLMATYFSSNRSLAIGVATTGNAVGGMIYPVLVQQLLPKIGFAWTTRVLGFLNLALLAIVIAFMRPRLPPRKSGPILDWSAWREPPYAFFVSGVFFAVWAIYYTFYYIASFGIATVSLSYSSSTSLIILLNGVGVPSRIIPPYFADKLGPLNLIVPTLLLMTVVAYTWLAVASLPSLYAFTVLYGLVTAAFQCLIPSTVASLTPDLRMVGSRLGMAFSTLSFAALTGPPIGGALQSRMGGQFWGATVFAATSTAVAFGLIGAARVAKVGWRVRKKC
ncbi:hypothetical protein LTR91_018817 [Friedmanniomyces endolithicus]|uniref:Major facilitator superfamily (MFS) profile domain-containing protein n=1 Tax=Friedmanniomyces endolithicus TaxID=329885 RepID=A0AAN6JKV7_9PEZI|nr:hypothetical protein LTR01_000563 [Friedmanniomyces endolithicus]KAK0328023.1 hypothetical protein LTR82_001542 [Friedmanniomyces endolithicus]KAK0834989.1 hypothetical protein LTR73_001281 [Friedmanniomyces endolithicus]KAK0900039.1 hypothetical protein LTR57_020795 [Friedmanniomyces endolithicus]KAK0963731.1 hypothetical protein LTR91_018817 [Friedmanniomyces endolithicus]